MNKLISVLTFYCFILLSLSLRSMDYAHNTLFKTYQANDYTNYQTNDNCTVKIFDKGRYIAIDSIDPMQIAFDTQTNYLNFKNYYLNIPFNCFAQIEGKIVYGVRINTAFYINAQEIKPKVCDDTEIRKYPIVLVNPNISIYAPLCTFIARDHDNSDNIVLKASIDALNQLNVTSKIDPETKLIKYIHIYPKNGASFVTSKPIVCFVPSKTPFFTTYNSIEQNNNLQNS